MAGAAAAEHNDEAAEAAGLLAAARATRNIDWLRAIWQSAFDRDLIYVTPAGEDDMLHTLLVDRTLDLHVPLRLVEPPSDNDS